MERSLFGCLAIFASSCSLAAPSVNLYGTVDVGLKAVSNQAAMTDSEHRRKATLVSADSGGISPSVIGIKGREVVNEGLEVRFNIESHIDASTGAGGLGSLWSRAANVSVSTPLGTICVGQQMLPSVIGYAATDPRGLRESLSGLTPWAQSSIQNIGASAPTPNSTLGVFASNAVSYAKDWGASSFSFLYAPGEVATNSNAGRLISGQYTYNGPIIVSLGYHEGRWKSSGELSERKAFLGSGVNIGGFKVSANFLLAKSFESNGLMFGSWAVWGLGGEASLSPRSNLTVAYYRGQNRIDGTSKGAADSFVVSNEFLFSKRTTVYGQFAAVYAGKDADHVVSVLGDQLNQGGGTSYLFNVGIRHRF